MGAECGGVGANLVAFAWSSIVSVNSAPRMASEAEIRTAISKYVS
jgi:hypothetical protein